MARLGAIRFVARVPTDLVRTVGSVWPLAASSANRLGWKIGTTIAVTEKKEY